jgi:carbamoyltransferase
MAEVGCDWSDVDLVAHYCRFTEDGVAARLSRVGRGLPVELFVLLKDEYEAAMAHRLAPEVVRGQLERIADEPIPMDRFESVPHHLAHTAGAFYSSGFDHALCVTIDGYGEEESAVWTTGAPGHLEPRGRVFLPSSLGTLYQVVTSFLGFRTFGDEYKTMGLAGYGNPSKYAQVFADLVELEDDGSWSTVNFCRPDLSLWLEDRLGAIRQPGACTEHNADIAAALQSSLERSVLHMLGVLRDRYAMDQLCLGGGVALNAVMNGAIVRSGLFRRLFLQPAASDDGAALGAAMYTMARHTGSTFCGPISHMCWGPGYSNAHIGDVLRQAAGVESEYVEDVEARTAALLAGGKIVGWYQGRMELGPRALGSRSILATPASAQVRDRINDLVKQREKFRPFGPSVLAEAAIRFFEIPDDTAAPYMIVTYVTREVHRRQIEGVVHLDGSARVQIVRREEEPRYHLLLTEFEALTGLPVLLNTSFNRAGEPIVCTPGDALECFIRSGLDALVMGDYIVFRADEEEESA